MHEMVDRPIRKPPYWRSLLSQHWIEIALTGMAIVTIAAMLKGESANVWTLLLSGSFGLTYGLVPVFRGRVNALVHAAWQEVRAFPAAGGSIPWRALVVLVVMPNSLLLLIRDRGVQSGDSRPVVMTAASLLIDHDTELSEFVESYTRHRLFTPTDEPPYFFLRRPNGIYSHYPSGMVPFALPAVAAAHGVGADVQDPTVHERLEKLTAAFVSTACLALFLLLALHLAEARTAYIASVILATGSAMFSTVGQALWQQGGVIFWMELLLLIEFRSWQSPSWKSVAWQGVCCAMMAACRLSAGLIVILFGAWLLVRAPRRALAVAAVAGLAAMPWGLFHWLTYGTVLGPMAVQTSGSFWSLGNLGACAGVLFSPTHGLLVYQPWLLLLVLNLWPSLCRASQSSRAPLPRGWRLWAMAVVVGHLALVSSWWCWWGGWCWGSRLLSEDLPLLALLTLGPLATLLATPRRSRWVLAIAIVSALLHVPSVYFDQKRWYGRPEPEVASLWRWTAPPFLYPLRR